MRALIAERAGARAGQRRAARAPTASSARCTRRSCVRSSRSTATRRGRRATCRCCAGWLTFLPFLRLARRLVGEARAELAALAARRLAAARAGVDDGGERGALPPALGLGARAAARGARRRAGSALSPSPACSPRWPRSPATTPGSRCPMVAVAAWWLRARSRGPLPRARGPRRLRRWRRRSSRWPGWPGARAPAAIRSSSSTTSRAITPSSRPTAPARYGARAGAGAPARRLVAGVRRRDDAPGPRPRRRRARARRAAHAVRRPCASCWSPRSAPPALYLAQGSSARASSRCRASRSSRARCCCRSPRRAVPLGRARAVRAGAFVSAAAFSVAVWLVATVGRERIWGGAESMGALTRLDGEDRALAAHLRALRAPGRARDDRAARLRRHRHRARGGRALDRGRHARSSRASRGRPRRDSLLSTGARRMASSTTIAPAAGRRGCPTGPGGARFGRWIVIGRKTPGAI